MAIKLADIHPEVIRAYYMVNRAESILADPYSYGERINKARVTKARNFFYKKKKQHLGELSQEESIALYTMLDKADYEGAA